MHVLRDRAEEGRTHYRAVSRAIGQALKGRFEPSLVAPTSGRLSELILRLERLQYDAHSDCAADVRRTGRN
jgi:hypothetical protein